MPLGEVFYLFHSSPLVLVTLSPNSPHNYFLPYLFLISCPHLPRHFFALNSTPLRTCHFLLYYTL